jgi:hypothetical protein
VVVCVGAGVGLADQEAVGEALRVGVGLVVGEGVLLGDPVSEKYGAAVAERWGTGLCACRSGVDEGRSAGDGPARVVVPRATPVTAPPTALNPTTAQERRRVEPP